MGARATIKIETDTGVAAVRALASHVYSARDLAAGSSSGSFRITASVDWNADLGAITRANLALGGPALSFENIVGHENTRCTKLLTSEIGSRRQIQLMLGLSEGTSDSAIVRHLRDAFKKPTRRCEATRRRRIMIEPSGPDLARELEAFISAVRGVASLT